MELGCIFILSSPHSQTGSGANENRPESCHIRWLRMQMQISRISSMMMLDALACWGFAGGVKVSCSGSSPLVFTVPLLREMTVFYPAQHPVWFQIQCNFTRTGDHLNFL